MPFVSTSQDSSPTGICSRLPEVDLWEPYDGRLSRTVLREPGGEIPPGYSPEPEKYGSGVHRTPSPNWLPMNLSASLVDVDDTWL